MIGNILSPTHLLLVLAVALIVLGPKLLPEVGRGLGSAIRDFKSVLSGADLTDERALESLSEPDRGAVASPPDPSAASRHEDTDAGRKRTRRMIECAATAGKPRIERRSATARTRRQTLPTTGRQKLLGRNNAGPMARGPAPAAESPTRADVNTALAARSLHDGRQRFGFMTLHDRGEPRTEFRPTAISPSRSTTLRRDCE